MKTALYKSSANLIVLENPHHKQTVATKSSTNVIWMFSFPDRSYEEHNLIIQNALMEKQKNMFLLVLLHLKP